MERKENPHAGHRQRKKEQFRRHGLDAFAPHEALELLLYYAIPRVDTNGMAMRCCVVSAALTACSARRWRN